MKENSLQNKNKQKNIKRKGATMTRHRPSRYGDLAMFGKSSVFVSDFK